MSESTVKTEPGIPSMTAVQEPGAAWKINEEQIVPHNNIPLVFFSLMLTTFLVCASVTSMELLCSVILLSCLGCP